MSSCAEYIREQYPDISNKSEYNVCMAFLSPDNPLVVMQGTSDALKFGIAGGVVAILVLIAILIVTLIISRR